MRIALPDIAEQIEATTTGEAYVQKQQVESVLFEARKPGFTGLGGSHGIAFGGKEQLENFANFCFVVYDQDRAIRHEPFSLPPEIPSGKRCLCQELSAPRFCRHAL